MYPVLSYSVLHKIVFSGCALPCETPLWWEKMTVHLEEIFEQHHLSGITHIAEIDK